MDARHGILPEDSSNGQSHLSSDSPIARALRDITFGSVSPRLHIWQRSGSDFKQFAGMVSEVFEYPFDLAKVRLQSQVLENTTRFGGPLDCLKQTWRNEGVRGLYRVSCNNLLWLRILICIDVFAYRAFQYPWWGPWLRRRAFSSRIVNSKPLFAGCACGP